MPATINLAGTTVYLEQLPALLAELDLMPLLLRRHIERQSTAAIEPDRNQQIEYQKAFLAAERIRDKASLESWLLKQQISEQQMSQRLFQALQVELFQQQTFGPKAEPIFLERKSSLDRVTYSLLRVRNRAQAIELHLRLQEEEASFADLASEYSQGMEQQHNGMIGPMEMGLINPVLAERLRISQPGQLWPPFEAAEWWVILRHERHHPAKLDQAMRKRLISELYEGWIRKQVLTALEDLGLAETNPNPLETPGSADGTDVPVTFDLPAADALQPAPTPEPENSTEHRSRGLLRSLFGRGKTDA